MTFDGFDHWWWPFMFILLAGWLPTGIWRYLGVYFSGSLDEDAEILVFVRALATAMVATVIAKLILYPEGVLAAIPVTWRIAAAVSGFLAYHLFGKRIFAGVVVGEAFLIGSMVLTQTS